MPTHTTVYRELLLVSYITVNMWDRISISSADMLNFRTPSTTMPPSLLQNKPYRFCRVPTKTNVPVAFEWI